MEICVFGAGSLGSLVGGLLARQHDVTLIGREPHVTTVSEDCLAVTGEFEFTVSPTVAATPPAADLAVVTVKSFDTAGAATALSGSGVDAVLSLQNGMGNEETLAAELSCPVLAGTCTYGATLLEPGVVECTGIGEIALGPRDGGMSSLAERVGDAFQQAGLETVIASDMPRRLWKKLAINAGINAATALARVPNGALVDGPASSVARRGAREAARTGATDAVDPEDAVEATISVATQTAANTSSMYQDVRAGKRTEIDAINGYVVEHATDPVPINETLTALVRGWEQERNLRSQ